MTARLLLAAVAAIVPLPAHSTLWSDATPPLRFQGPGVAVLVTVPSSEVQKDCGVKPPPDMEIMACSYLTKEGTPVIVVPNPCETEALDPFAHLLCHEAAHAMHGWPQTHGD
jgi:hypothetical protein